MEARDIHQTAAFNWLHGWAESTLCMLSVVCTDTKSASHLYILYSFHKENVEHLRWLLLPRNFTNKLWPTGTSDCTYKFTLQKNRFTLHIRQLFIIYE